MMILNENEKVYSEPNVWIILLNAHTSKSLSVITIKEEFLFSIQKFRSL